MAHNLQGDQSPAEQPDDDSEAFSPRRIRHITAIQIRNLTPFPVRDAFASALSQPAEQPQFTTHGHLSDDLDVTVGRKRGRRISVNSVHTLKSVKSDDGEEAEREGRVRRRTGSRVSFSDAASLGAGSSPSSARRQATGPTVRPGNRQRTASIASTQSAHFKTPSTLTTTAAPHTSAPISLSAMLPDHSQKGLEKVFKSRLVETFIAVTVLSSDIPSVPNGDKYQRDASLPYSAPSTKDKFLSLPSKVRPLTPPHSVPSTKEKLPNLPHKPHMSRKSPHSPSPDSPKGTHVRREPSTSTTSFHSKSSSVSSHPTRKPPSKSHAPPTVHTTQPSPHPTTPDYISSVHRPSTNPAFAIDARAGYDFGAWTDLSADRLRIEVWGRAHAGKGKARADEAEWKVLEEWKVNLAQLVPLPEDLAARPAHLPFNTLLVTLSPPGRTFYTPPLPLSPSREPSPMGGGYSSDPESSAGASKRPMPPPPRPRGASGRLRRTAGWQELLKLATLQACIIDTAQSLSEVVREIDRSIERDDASPLRREVSEREAWVEMLREERQTVEDRSEELKSKIEARGEALRQRREMLSLAKEQHEQELALSADVSLSVSAENQRLCALRRRLPPTRATLLSTLSTIYPIELLSPPDLLYTILFVPLPIPLSAGDPAPPLALPAQREVTEEAVATALGYAAQVVQLLAAYLGKGLVYPVTCVGSRSLIRDGISAMVGPRMFPLFSRGVDTYRFEYGVFLLNKDIELLMADRDLRALDMRHTLPNLKNLLLTLTDGGSAPRGAPRRPVSPISSVSGLESPRAESPSAEEEPPAAAGDDRAVPMDSAESGSPTGSGATTPTAGAGEGSGSRMSRAFLGLSPLTGFLRSRYPSASGRLSVKTGREEDGCAVDEGEEEDRRTVRGVGVEGNGHANGEKVAGDEAAAGVVADTMARRVT